MKIPIDRIPEGGGFFEEDAAASEYGLVYADFAFQDPVHVAVRAQLISGNLVVSGQVSTKISMTCSRCLKHFTRIWEDKDFHFDCEAIAPNATIDLTDDIREDIIVGLPVKPLCRQDCKGLCPGCGINWNEATCECRKKTDIRWDSLDKLKWE